MYDEDGPIDEDLIFPAKEPDLLEEIQGWYTDDEGNVVCEDCAKQSNNFSVPAVHRPQHRHEPEKGETCLECRTTWEG